MPLNASEKVDFAKAMLRCYGTDFNTCGRTLAYLKQFSVGAVDMVAEVKNQATTWQPFIDQGESIEGPGGWKSELQRVYDQTLAGIQ